MLDVQARGELHELTLLVLGGSHTAFPHLTRYQTSLDPRNDADAVLLAPGAGRDDFAILHRHAKLLLPIIDASGMNLSRADQRIVSLSAESVDAALVAINPLRDRLNRLPDYRRSGDRDALTALALAVTRETGIEAGYDAEIPAFVTYPLLSGIPDPGAILQELARARLLSSRPFDRLHICPNCSSSRLNVREECVECRSSYILEESLVHHYRCAFQGPEKRFIHDQALVCPKCHRELRHFGVDYDKPGSVIICGDCGHDTPEAAIGFRCLDCGRHADSEAVDTRQWFHYELTPDVFTAVEAGVLPHNSLQGVIGQYRGAYTVRDFLTLLKFHRAVVDRYKRPLTVISVAIRNIESVQREVGIRGLNQALVLLGEAISEGLRRSDAVAATADHIYLLLPETDPVYSEMLAHRIRKQVKEKLSVLLEVDCHAVPAEELDQLPAKLIG